MVAVQWKARPRTQQDFLEALADALGVETGARTNMPPTCRRSSAYGSVTRTSSSSIQSSWIGSTTRKIRRYYRETWPSLLPATSPSGCVKCVQPIEWRLVPPLKRVGARVAMALWPGLTHADWVAQGADEALAADLVRDLQACTSPSFRIHPLPALGDIPDAEIEEFCERLGLSSEQRERLLSRVRSVSRTPEDFLKAIDDYYPEVCGA